MTDNSKDYKDLIRARVLDDEQFSRATLSGSLPGQTVPWKKVVIRPVLVKRKKSLQFSYFDDKKDITKNYFDKEAMGKLNELLILPFKNFHVQTATHAMQINLSKKGKPLIRETEVRESDKKEINLSHNREKDLILPAHKPEPFLRAIGIMTQEGKIKSDMQSKFRQINEYLRLIEQMGVVQTFRPGPLHVVDCGCGNAYLTFATYHYFTAVLGLEIRMIGIDVQANLLQRHSANAEGLGWDDLSFEATRIIDYRPDFCPDVVLALHACDTATDEAIAQGIGWQSKLILAAPCCHHELQVQLHSQPCPAPFRPVARHGILSERLGDILTDAFRALVLRIMGYRTEVVQFVSSEHTAKNLMIRAVGGLSTGDRRFVQEYNELKEYWHVTPYLERLLGEAFTRLLTESAEDVTTDHRPPTTDH